MESDPQRDPRTDRTRPRRVRPSGVGRRHQPQPAELLGHVHLTFPNADRFSMLTRMTGASMAATAGFNVAEIDQLRRALDGIWTALSSSTPPGHSLHLGFDAEPRCLRLSVRSRPQPVAGGADRPESAPAVELDIAWHAGQMAPGQ